MSKIGIGVVGAGSMGATLMRRIVGREDAEIVSLHQHSEENAITVLKELGLSEELFVPDYITMLEDPEVDAVFICSTNEAHGPQAIAAQAAGKHVFCETPCATDFGDYLVQLEYEAENPEKVTFVDYLVNFDTFEERIRQMSAAGLFGTITQIQVNYRHLIDIDGDKRWKLSKNRMGDAIGMGIIDSLFVMLNVMEAQGATPCGVFATSSPLSERGFEAPPVWNIQVVFDNGATGFCFGNVDGANGYDVYHDIHGTKGGLIFDPYLDRKSKVRCWAEDMAGVKWIHPLDPERCEREGVEQFVWSKRTTTPDSKNAVNHQTKACVEHFLKCIQEGKQSTLSFGNSAKVADVGWAAQLSAARCEFVPLPLDKADAQYFFYSRK